MRKVYIIALAIISLMASSVSCTTDYDETEVRDILAQLEDKVKDLEDACKRLNDNVIALNELLGISSSGDYITGISEITDGSGALVGYRISFKIHDELTIYNGHKGSKGDDGADNSDYIPTIGVAAVDGVYYWTLDGKFILDANGNRIRATGADGHDGKDSVVPQIRIKDGYWEVSTDESHSTWTRLGRADGYDYSDHTIFKSVTDRGSVIEFTLANGTSFTIRKNGQDVPNSVVVIPDYSDGSVAIPFTNSGENYQSMETHINFMISPSELVDAVVSNGAKSVELKVKYSETDLSDKDGSFTITRLSKSPEGILSLGAYGNLDSGFYTGTRSASACLTIKSGESTVNSPYFPLTPLKSTPTHTDLSALGTANCYIISSPGSYQFLATKQGNSAISVGTPASASVVWESYGTSVTPSVGSLVQNVSFSDGYIKFNTPDALKNGNAVIAVKNSSGTILWSWHIWICSGYNPDATSHTYPNNAVMMDRNLGATSSTTNAAASLGLLYQWGRKDPFVSSYSISGSYRASATKTWTSATNSSTTGTMAYSIQNPTVFIKQSSNYHWLTNADMTCWGSVKTKYDPCPTGWRVPDGENETPWAPFNTAKYASSYYGYYLNGEYWYPFVGYISPTGGALTDVGASSRYWTVTRATNNPNRISGMFFDKTSLQPNEDGYPADGRAVRCMKEGNGPSLLTVTPTTLSLECTSGSSATATITTNADWTVTGLPTWLSVSKSSGKGNATITFTANSNNTSTSASRTANVTISMPGRSVGVQITQKYSDYISVDQSSYNLDYRNGSYVDMNISSNAEWRILNTPSTVSFSSLNGTGDKTVRITVKSENTTSTVRSLGSFVISSAHNSITVSLTQKEGGEISARYYSLSFGYKSGASNEDYIRSNTNWTIEGLPSWLTASPMSGTGDTQVTFTTTSANPSTTARSGSFRVSIGTDEISISVNQAGSPPKAYVDFTRMVRLSNYLVFEPQGFDGAYSYCILSYAGHVNYSDDYLISQSNSSEWNYLSDNYIHSRNGLSAGTDYTVYIVCKDASGNYGEITSWRTSTLSTSYYTSITNTGYTSSNWSWSTSMGSGVKGYYLAAFDNTDSYAYARASQFVAFGMLYWWNLPVYDSGYSWSRSIDGSTSVKIYTWSQDSTGSMSGIIRSATISKSGALSIATPESVQTEDDEPEISSMRTSDIKEMMSRASVIRR